jgi:hypothetical protein
LYKVETLDPIVLLFLWSFSSLYDFLFHFFWDLVPYMILKRYFYLQCTREIHEQYQAKIVALRTQHAKRREEFFRHELLSRVGQHQQPVLSKQYHETAGGPMLGHDDHRGYGTGLGEGHQVYPGGYESRRDEMQYYGVRFRVKLQNSSLF